MAVLLAVPLSLTPTRCLWTSLATLLSVALAPTLTARVQQARLLAEAHWQPMTTPVQARPSSASASAATGIVA